MLFFLVSMTKRRKIKVDHTFFYVDEYLVVIGFSLLYVFGAGLGRGAIRRRSRSFTGWPRIYIDDLTCTRRITCIQAVKRIFCGQYTVALVYSGLHLLPSV